MQNVTISLDDRTLRLTEAEAQKAGQSLSDYISEIVARVVSLGPPREPELNEQQKALQRIFAGPMWDVTENGRMPTSEERNARG